MYFPEDNCPFYRATYLSNYSPHMTPEPYTTDANGRRNGRYYSLLCETSSSEFKPVDRSRIAEDTIRGLKMGARFAPDMAGMDISAIHAAIKEGMQGKIVEIDDENDDERVEIFVE